MITLDLPFKSTPRRQTRTLYGGQGGYAGARSSNLEWDWVAGMLSADQVIKTSLRKLRDRSRQLARDDAHMARFLHLLRSQVIGHRGIQLQSRITAGSTGNLRENFNTAIEKAFQRWGRKGTCTIDGRLTWKDAQRLYLTNLAVDGEILIRHRPVPNNPYGYTIQFLDPDVLDETFDRDADPEHGINRVIMGVEVDLEDRPIAYHILTRHPSDRSFIAREVHRARIPANQIIHDYVLQRPGQTRGVPWVAPVMLTMNMMHGFTEAHLVASRVSAAKPVFYEQDSISPVIDEDGQPIGTELVEEAAPGTHHLLPPGVKAHQMDPNFPTENFESFQRGMLHTVSGGLNSSYAAMTGDLKDVNFTSGRMGTMVERDAYRELQDRVVDCFCDPIFRHWLPMAAMRQAVMVPVADLAQTDKLADQVMWQPRGWASVQPLDDIQAAEARIALGVSTRSAECAAQGTSYEDNLIQLAREEQLAAESGVSVAGLKAGSSNGQADAGTAPTGDRHALSGDAGGGHKGNGGGGRIPDLDRLLVGDG